MTIELQTAPQIEDEPAGEPLQPLEELAADVRELADIFEQFRALIWGDDD